MKRGSRTWIITGTVNTAACYKTSHHDIYTHGATTSRQFEYYLTLHWANTELLNIDSTVERLQIFTDRGLCNLKFSILYSGIQISYELPISRTSFRFPWRFEKSGFHCKTNTRGYLLFHYFQYSVQTSFFSRQDKIRI